MVLPTVRTRRIALPLQASRRKVRFCSPTASLPKEFLRPPIRPACRSRLLEHDTGTFVKHHWFSANGICSLAPGLAMSAASYIAQRRVVFYG